MWGRRHAIFLTFLLVGTARRIFQGLPLSPPSIVGELGSHLYSVTTWTLGAAHSGGDGVLAPLSWSTGALAAVVAVHHLLGLATGIIVYVLLLRWGVWRWLAALATVAVLVEPDELAGEHLVFPDALFVFVVAVGLLVLCWRSRPSVAAALLGGALLGLATGVRLAGAPLVLTHQDLGYPPGPFLLGGLLLGFLAVAGVGRAGPSGMRTVCLLAAVVPAVMLLGAVSTAEFSWRSQLPGLVLWPAAAALGLTALLRGRRSPAAGRSQIDAVDRAALAAFRRRHGDPALAPVVVVIAAYNEVDGLPRVLSSLPSTVCGLAADVVIVDDGSTDGTTAAASAHSDAYLVTSPINRGQGAAMRLGYLVARSHGARYIITTDADAQYDAADFPTVLAPVLDGSADFVTGSRRLGRQHANDLLRRAGVYVFAWMVSALTGRRLTDTSFGLRAMRAEVTAAVTLNQPQYQSAELLIGAHSRGYRIAEVPGSMHLRAAGSTKKGGNVVYGMRYARVVLGTWWREGCPAPARERAPAMSGQENPIGTRLLSGR